MESMKRWKVDLGPRQVISINRLIEDCRSELNLCTVLHGVKGKIVVERLETRPLESDGDGKLEQILCKLGEAMAWTLTAANATEFREALKMLVEFVGRVTIDRSRA